MIFTITVFTLFFADNTVFSQRGGRSQEIIEVRLASPMPRNSDWGRTLDRLAAEWARVTNNEVRLRVIHDGVEGGDAKLFPSLATDNIQASLFTSHGISRFCPAVMTLSIPFLIGNDAELDLVLNEVLPVLEEQISKTNYVVLAWSRGGWVNVFSKNPITVPDDLRGHKLASDAEAEEMNMAFKAMGFNMIDTDMVDLGTRLANNMINAIYQTPAAVAPLGLYKYLGNMLDMPIAPYLGAIVMNRVTWNKLGSERQREITRVTRRIAAEFDESMPKTVANALTMMQRAGLKINKGQEILWRNEVNKAIPSLIGTAFDRDIYRFVNEILEKSRNER